MSIPDPLIEKYLRLISGLSPSEIEATLKLKPRDAKAALARQLVKRLHGEEAAARAETDFDQKFRQHLAPDEMPEIVPSNPEDLTQTLVEAGLARTRSEANRLIQQGGVSVKGTRVSGLPFRLEDGDVVKVGKRNFVRIRLK
jgi:tyrosyl-tRNA synthetase